MKAFQFNPIDGAMCPVCGKNEVKDATNLVVLNKETEPKLGDTVETVQVHVQCIMEGLALFPGPIGSVIGKAAPYYTKETIELKS